MEGLWDQVGYLGGCMSGPAELLLSSLNSTPWCNADGLSLLLLVLPAPTGSGSLAEGVLLA